MKYLSALDYIDIDIAAILDYKGIDTKLDKQEFSNHLEKNFSKMLIIIY